MSTLVKFSILWLLQSVSSVHKDIPPGNNGQADDIRMDFRYLRETAKTHLGAGRQRFAGDGTGKRTYYDHDHRRVSRPILGEFSYKPQPSEKFSNQPHKTKPKYEMLRPLETPRMNITHRLSKDSSYRNISMFILTNCLLHAHQYYDISQLMSIIMLQMGLRLVLLQIWLPLRSITMVIFLASLLAFANHKFSEEKLVDRDHFLDQWQG